MKRFSGILLLLAFVACGIGAFGCGNENDPLYWVDKIKKRPQRELALKKLNEQFGRVKASNNNNLAAPAVREFSDRVIPELIGVYKEIRRDRINRLEIIKLLAQMGNPKAEELIESLDLSGSYDSQIFTTSANALGRGGVAQALPKLLAAHQGLVNERTARGNSPYTKRENEIDESIITAVISIALKNPNVPERAQIVEMLNQVTDTRDTQQDLRLNMKAIKGLGQIGDAAAIPTLIRGIAMQGEVQKVGLGPFAFVSLQQIMDRDAVVEQILNFGQGKDAAFNEYFKEELESDPMLKVKVWTIQQAIEFLGTLNYPSSKAVAFLMAEVNHNEPDEIDKQSAAKGEGAQKFDASGWAAWRRNWAAVALAQLDQKQALDIVKERFKFKKGGGGKLDLAVTAEEAVGFLRALGYLQYPADSCPLLVDAAKTGSEALKDKTFYYAGIMTCKGVLPTIKEEYDKTDCKKMIAERFPEDASENEKKKAETDCNTLKNRMKSYMDGIDFGKRCGDDFDCYLKEASDRTSPTIEAAIYGAYRLARGDEAKSKQLVETLSKELDNPVMSVLEVNLFVLDRLTPNGDKALIDRGEQVRKNFASQQTYKDRARLLEAFIGHVKARTK